MKHFGRWFRDQLDGSPLSKKAFAASIGVEPVTLRSWYKAPRMAIRSSTVVRLAKALRTTPESLNAQFGPEAGSVNGMLVPGMPVGEDGKVVAADGTFVKLGKTDPRLVRDVPIINSIAAGPLTEFADSSYPPAIADSFVRMAVGDMPAFGLWIVGDSMSPRYESGDLVIFRQFELGAEPLRAGLDYALLMGQPEPVSTFKRIELTRSRFIIYGVAINPSFRPQRTKIDLREVVSIGVAVDIVLGGRRR